MKFQVYLKVANGGVTPVFKTNSFNHAFGFCKSKNDFYKRISSPNKYYFEIVK